MSKLVYLVPLFPLLGFLINGLGRRSLSKTMISVIGTGAITASFVVSLVLFSDVKLHGSSISVLFNFIDTAGFKIPLLSRVDQLSALFLLIITGIGSLIHLYSSVYMID